jgi:hypothetical protein
MKILHMLGWLLCLLSLTISSVSWADTATCRIKIEDINKGSTYKLEHRFTFKTGGDAQESILKLQEMITLAPWLSLNSGKAPCFHVNTRLTWAKPSSSLIEAF